MRFEIPNMAQAEGQIGRTVAAFKLAAAWARAHAALVIFALLCVSVPLWLFEHDARLKQSLELQQQRRATTAEVAQLRARAESAMNEFRASAQVIESLEARRQALERAAAALRQKLLSLREEERIRAQSASTPGQAELSGRVPSRLGLEEEVSGVRSQVSGGPRLRGDDGHSRESGNLSDTRHLTPRLPPAASKPECRTSCSRTASSAWK